MTRPCRDWKPVAASVFRRRMSLVLQSLLPDPGSCQGPSPHQQGWDTKIGCAEPKFDEPGGGRLGHQKLERDQPIRRRLSNSSAERPRS